MNLTRLLEQYLYWRRRDGPMKASIHVSIKSYDTSAMDQLMIPDPSADASASVRFVECP